MNCYKYSIKKNVLSLMPVLFFLWILFAFSNGNADSAEYQKFYKYLKTNTTYGGVEIGFSYFMHICNICGLNYQQFLMIYSAIGLLLIGKFIQKYTNNPILIVLCYLFHPFVFEICQIRNFMASAIVIYGISFLIDKDKMSNLKYVITVVIASLFHRAALIYFILLLVNLKLDKLIRCLILILFLEIIGILVLLKYGMRILQLLSLFSKLNHYVNDSASTRLATKFFFILYYCAMGFVVFSISKCNGFKRKNNAIFVDVECKLLLTTFVFFPLFFVSMDFERFTRNLLLIYYIISTNYIYYKTKERKEKSVAEVVIIVLTFSIIYFLSFYFSFESTILPVFKNNLLFSGQFVY